MPLRYAPEPTNGSALVRASIDRLSTRKNYLTAKAIDFGATTIHPPHAIYDLHADEVAAGRGLDAAHLTGHRYLVHAAGSPVAAAEVHSNEAGVAALVANINYGPFVEATARGLDALNRSPDVQAGSYEARLLRFSAIQVIAIWLKADSGGQDIVYPLAPAPSVLQPERTYTVDDFLKAILPLAKQRASSAGGPALP